MLLSNDFENGAVGVKFYENSNLFVNILAQFRQELMGARKPNNMLFFKFLFAQLCHRARNPHFISSNGCLRASTEFYTCIGTCHIRQFNDYIRQRERNIQIFGLYVKAVCWSIRQKFWTKFDKTDRVECAEASRIRRSLTVYNELELVSGQIQKRGCRNLIQIPLRDVGKNSYGSVPWCSSGGRDSRCEWLRTSNFPVAVSTTDGNHYRLPHWGLPRLLL